MSTLLLSFIVVAILLVVLIGIFCIPTVQTIFVWLAVFFVTYAPSIITTIIILSSLVILPLTVLGSIYGLSTLAVLLLLATFSIWSSVARWLTTTILIVGLLTTFFYPPVKNFIVTTYPSSIEWMSNNKEYTNIKIKESSLSMKNAIRDSEVTIGTLGYILKDGIGYDDFGRPGRAIQKGQPVKSMGEIKSQDETGNEGLIKLMGTNSHGDFVGGPCFWYPIQKVAWEKQVMEKEDKDTPPPPAPISTPNSQRLNGQMADADLCFDGNCYRGKITLTGDLFAFNGGGLSLAGARDKNSVWTGSWNKNREPTKNFTLRFTKTNHFSGEVYTGNGRMEFSVAVIPATIISAR